MGSKKRILLTGASGTVGYEVLKQLVAAKELYCVTVFDVQNSNSKKKISAFDDNIKIIYGDISRPEDLEEATRDQDVTIHLAATIPPVSDENPDLAYSVNVDGTRNLITALEKNSPNSFFLYSSSISIYGDRLKTPMIKVTDALIPSVGDAYAQTKIEAEKLVQNSKLDWSIFRLAAIMGGHKISKLMFEQPLDTSLEIATPEDTGRAFVKAIEKQERLSKQIFNLGGGSSCRISYKDFLINSFHIYGLGKLNFPDKAFAEKNFHCGFYEDGNELARILHFRNDTLMDYFEKEIKNVSTFQKAITSIFKKPIKYFLLKKSEPYAAYQKKDENLKQHYFN